MTSYLKLPQMAGSSSPSALKNITPRSPYFFARSILSSADWESLNDTNSVFVAFAGSGAEADRERLRLRGRNIRGEDRRDPGHIGARLIGVAQLIRIVAHGRDAHEIRAIHRFLEREAPHALIRRYAVLPRNLIFISVGRNAKHDLLRIDRFQHVLKHPRDPRRIGNRRIERAAPLSASSVRSIVPWSYAITRISSQYLLRPHNRPNKEEDSAASPKCPPRATAARSCTSAFFLPHAGGSRAPR